jgi:hypothetical protein
MRTALHLPNSRVIDVDGLGDIEFDGTIPPETYEQRVI